MNESSVIMFEDLPRDEQVDLIISTIEADCWTSRGGF